MTLGYCILHANRIDTALTGMREDAIAGDEGIDMGLGAIALREPGELLTGYLDGVARQAQAVLTRMQQAFSTGGGVFADLQRWFAEITSASFDDFRLTPWVDRLADLFVALEPTVIAGRLDALLERVAIALPELNGGGLLDSILDIVLGGLDVLERRRLDGQDDVAGHRAFRMARIVRIWLGEALEEVRTQLAELDLISVVRRAAQSLLGGVSSPGTESLRELGDQVRTKLRPFAVAIDALLAIRVSVNVDASVETLPELGDLWLDDNLAAPHGPGHPLWWLDLAGGVASLSFTIVDVQRFNPFYGPRTGDAILSLLNLSWQTVRTLARAIRPDFLQENHTTTGAAFWFSELGDFCVQLFLNLLGSLHEAGDAGSNWVMSLATRLARWFTFTLQPRIPYMFSRAVWYMRAWKEQGWVTEHVVAAGETIDSIAGARGLDPVRLRVWNRIAAGEEPSLGDKLRIPADPPGERPGSERAGFSFARHAWSTWAWLWLVGAINGVCQSWEDMQLDDLGSTDFVKLGIWLGPLVGALAAIFMPPLISGGEVWPDVNYEIDWATFSVFMGMLLLVIGMVAGSMYSTNVTSGLWWIMLIVAAVAICLLFIPVMVAWLEDPPDPGAASGWLYAWMLICGVVVFGLLTTILWWIYKDDGRDKHGKFTGLEASTSPYKLPWKKGDVWICGQGFHGIFSHFARDNSFNHYGYDFLEGKDEPAMAARGGTVVTMRQCNPYGSPNQNDIAIAHLDWVAGHDPGTELERVQTYSHYIHIGPECARLDIDQYVLQGQHVVDIDSTGMSAQQHLHFGASQVPGSRWWADVDGDPGPRTLRNVSSDLGSGWARESVQLHGSRPVIFADPSLTRDRTNPILRWIEGHVHHPGRPLAQCLYQSDNASPPGPGSLRPIVLRTLAVAPAGEGSSHSHRLELSVEDMRAGDPVFTTVDAGHRHELRFTAAQLKELLRHALPGAWTTELELTDTLRHQHGFTPEAFAGGTLRAGTPTALIDETSRVDSPVAQVAVTAPPPAQLVAGKAGPYDLLARGLVVRVDDQGTELFHFGGCRARLVAQVAIGRSPRNTEVPSVQALRGTGPAPVLAPPAGRHGVRAGVAALDRGLVNTGVQLRLIPVLVLETRARGNAARLQLDGGASSAASFGIPGAGLDERGSGALADLHTLTRAQLVIAVARELNDAPTLASPTVALVHAQASVSATELRIDSNAVSVAGSGRTKQVFDALYDGGARSLVGTGPLPCDAGRVTLTWGPPNTALVVPIAGAPARAEIDEAAAWLGAGHFDKTPLEIVVGATSTSLHISAVGIPAIADAIQREVDGVRAWERAGKLWIETVDVGPEVTLMVRKAKPAGAGAGVDFALAQASTGEAPSLAGGAAMGDSASLERAELIRLVTDAAQRGQARHARATGIAANTKARVNVDLQDGTRLRLRVDAGHTISLQRNACCQAVLTALALTATTEGALANRELRSGVLSDPVALPSGGWLDLLVDADPVRVYLDAEPARVELAPVEVWPAATAARLRVQVGAEGWKSVTLDGLSSLDAIASAITAAAGAGLRVRVAHRVALEARHHGRLDLQMPNSLGRSALGFLSRTATLRAEGRGPAVDLQGVASAQEFTRARERVSGELRPNAYIAQLAGTPQRLELSASGHDVKVHWRGTAPDPFGFATDHSAAFATRALVKRVARYRVELHEAGVLGAVGSSEVELAASPAILRATRPASVLPLGGVDRLIVRVTWPEGGATRTLSSELDLRWATKLLLQRGTSATLAALEVELRRRVVDQLQRQVPRVQAWLIEHGEPATPACIHLQTAGAGTDWVLRLEGQRAIVALGFDPKRIVGGALEVRGGGNVGDEARVELDELRVAFVAAAAYTTFESTRAVYDVTTPAASDPNHKRLTIAAPGAAITLRVEPRELDLALPRITAGAQVVIDARQDLDLPGGRITVERDAQAVAAVFVIGSPARIRGQGAVPASPSPAEAALLTQLRGLPSGQELVIRADGRETRFGRFPRGLSSIDELVGYMARRAPQAFVSLQPSISGAGRDLVIESRVRGKSAAVELKFIGIAPVLGYTSDLSASGEGSFDDLARISHSQLQAALEAARDQPALGQSLVAGHHDASNHRVELRASDVGASLRQTTAVGVRSGATPSFVASAARADVLASAWNNPRQLFAKIAKFEWESESVVVGGRPATRAIHVPLWGNPARWDLGVNPSRASAFNGRSLALSVDGAAHLLRLDGVGSWAELAAQIERGCAWSVRAEVLSRINPSRRVLRISTLSEGSAARLTLRRATGSDARDLLDDPADAVAERQGRGPVPRMDAVDGAAMAAALGQGFTSRDDLRLASRVDAPTAWWGRYRPGAAGQGPVLRLRSQRLGCMSSIVPLAGHGAFSFDYSLQRGPAQRAAVVIPAGAQVVVPGEALLVVEFDDNGVGADVSAPRRVEVRIRARSYQRPELAATLQAALFGAGAGMAGCYPDGSIVVETMTPGLAGTVKLPATGSDPALVALLGLGGPPLEARGWPGGGQLEDLEAFRTGATIIPSRLTAAPMTSPLGSDYMPFRGLRASKTQPPTNNVSWRFFTDAPGTPGAFGSPALTLQGAWNAARVATELDTKLGQAVNTLGATRRIGHAKLGKDQTVQVEAMGARMLVLQVTPQGGAPGAIGVDNPELRPDGKLGERDDIKPEPGYDLRMTDTLRTYRLVYDRRGKGDTSVVGDFVDAGWHRPPTDYKWGTTRFYRTYHPLDVSSWARGRYLLAARAEAAKHDYGVDGEMVASFGHGPVEGKDWHFVRIARYWLGLTCLTKWNMSELWEVNGEPRHAPVPPATVGFANRAGIIEAQVHAPLCVGVRAFGGEVLLDWLV